MSSAVATMPSSISSGSTEHRRNPSESGTHGFTAVNITPPHSRESSATSPDTSPRHTSAGAGRNANSSNNFYTNGHDHPQLKRRRSMSSEQGPQSPRRYDYQPPRKAEAQQHMADRALHVLDSANKPPPHSYYSTAPAGQERPGYQYDRSYSNANGTHSTPEARMNESYQRDSSEHHYASSATGGDQDKNDDPNERATSQNGQKRKRNFSNRTKTGCITCRHRKKKCDEGRPQCNNCTRGGFICQGYNHSRPGSWPSKPAPQKQPVPLQSKETDDPNQYREVETPVSANPTNLETSQIRPAVANDGHDQPRPHYAPYPQPQPQPQPQASVPADPRPSYSGQQQHHPQWPQHAHHQQPPPQSQPQHGPSPQSSYPSEHLPSLSEITRPEQQQQQQQQQQQPQPPPQQGPPRQDYSTTPHRDMSRPSTQQNASAGPPPSSVSTPNQWQPQVPQYQQQPPPQQQEYGSRPTQYPPRIDTTQTQHLQASALANTASASYSSYEQKASSKLFTEKDVERSRMLRGALYNYFDATLRNERQRCSAALSRYNKACDWGSGVSETELHSMLAKVFDPQLDYTHSFLAVCREKGCIGPGVKIEQGFRCTYGYNLRIYDNVFIGENTRIDDSAKVEIGPRTWIGPDVKILTNDVAKDMIQRKGTDGQQCITQSVSIGPEVVIGTGAVIYPGVKLAKGSTVEAYAVVKNDVGEYITQKVATGAQMGATMMG